MEYNTKKEILNTYSKRYHFDFVNSVRFGKPTTINKNIKQQDIIGIGNIYQLLEEKYNILKKKGLDKDIQDYFLNLKTIRKYIYSNYNFIKPLSIANQYRFNKKEARLLETNATLFNNISLNNFGFQAFWYLVAFNENTGNFVNLMLDKLYNFDKKFFEQFSFKFVNKEKVIESILIDNFYDLYYDGSYEMFRKIYIERNLDGLTINIFNIEQDPLDDFSAGLLGSGYNVFLYLHSLQQSFLHTNILQTRLSNEIKLLKNDTSINMIKVNLYIFKKIYKEIYKIINSLNNNKLKRNIFKGYIDLVSITNDTFFLMLFNNLKILEDILKTLKNINKQDNIEKNIKHFESFVSLLKDKQADSLYDETFIKYQQQKEKEYKMFYKYNFSLNIINTSFVYNIFVNKDYKNNYKEYIKNNIQEVLDNKVLLGNIIYNEYLLDVNNKQLKEQLKKIYNSI